MNEMALHLMMIDEEYMGKTNGKTKKDRKKKDKLQAVVGDNHFFFIFIEQKSH